MLRKSFLLLAASVAVASPTLAATWKPQPGAAGDPAQRLRLYNIGRNYGDAHWDEAFGLIKRNPNKSGAHMLRESAYYAYALFRTGDPADRKRAERIIGQILIKQDLRQDQPTYGSLAFYWEDDWVQAPSAIDPNATPFVGVALGLILDEDQQQGRVMSPDLRRRLEAAFRLAVQATMRTDVSPGYTNIALLSSAMAVLGDRLLAVPGANDFAMSKLSWILSRSLPGTTLTEYLSPTYYGVDLSSAYLVRTYAKSPATVDAADRIIKYFWNDIADSYQSSTYQLAGPHSRSYGIDMTKYAAGLKWFLFLALDGKYPLQDVETDHDWDVGSLPILADLPVEVRPEFKTAPPEWREAVVEFRPKGGNRVIRQYRHGDLVLGTMSEQFLWQQQRNVVAYWPDSKPGGPVRFFQDVSPVTFGNGYAHQYTVQSKNAVLAAITGKSPVPAQGGMKLSFNADAKAEQLPGGGYSVASGDVTTYVYPVTQKTNSVVVHPETDTLSLERPWNTGDPAGNFQVLGYLLVFRTAGDPAPSVKDVAYKSADGKATLSADVDGTPLSLEVTR